MSFPWLIAQPIAHRGLHDISRGPIENSLGAAQAAIARGFAIECDVQLTRDGEAVVFHDSTLERLTDSSGAVVERTRAELANVRLHGGEAIPTLSELLTLIAGRVPLVCEIKSEFDGDLKGVERVERIAADYPGPLAIKSFDPAPIAWLRARGSERPLGIVAEASYDDPYFAALSPEQKRDCAAFLHIGATRPDFLSWSVDNLPHPTPSLIRALGRKPVITWTVRTREHKRLAALYADQIVFEGEPE